MSEIDNFLKSENVATLDHVIISLTRELSFEKTVVSDNDDSDDTWHNTSQRSPVISSLRQRSSKTPKINSGKC